MPVDSAGDLQGLMIGDVIGRHLNLKVLRDDRVIDVVAVPAELIE
jgi:hypothetical protein